MWLVRVFICCWYFILQVLMTQFNDKLYNDGSDRYEKGGCD